MRRPPLSPAIAAGTVLAALLLSAASAPARAGAQTGVILGAGPGTSLEVFQGNVKVTDIRVGVGGKYVVALGAGVYTVKCPNGRARKFAAVNGAATVNIDCR